MCTSAGESLRTRHTTLTLVVRISADGPKKMQVTVAILAQGTIRSDAPAQGLFALTVRSLPAKGVLCPSVPLGVLCRSMSPWGFYAPYVVLFVLCSLGVLCPPGVVLCPPRGFYALKGVRYP